MLGAIDGVEVAFLPRHGPGHYHLPTEVNYRANIYAMKCLGVEFLIGVSAVGSLQEEVVPGHVVLIDQYIDRTHHRVDTFFGEGCAGHVSMAHPICETLRQCLLTACQSVGTTVHDGGCYVNIEGPTFGTIAESNLYRSWGAKVVGMTTLPEARLAMEAEISYAVMAMATDYDCWHPSHDSVTVEQVVATANKNFETTCKTISACMLELSKLEGDSPRKGKAAKGAVMTSPSVMNHYTLAALAPVLAAHPELKADKAKARAFIEQHRGNCCEDPGCGDASCSSSSQDNTSSTVQTAAIAAVAGAAAALAAMYLVK